MSIGFTVSLRAPRRDEEPEQPSRGHSSPSDEPMLELRITSRPQYYGERPIAKKSLE